MAFDNDDKAAMARGALLADGFEESEVTRYTRDEVITECNKSTEESAKPAQVGQEMAKLDDYLALAKSGCGFLVVHATGDDRTKQAIAVVLPYGLKFAEKYNRLTMEAPA